MSCAIVTKYLGPTNTRGSRISASANGHKSVVPYDDSKNGDKNYANAAITLCLKMGWKGELIGGGTDDGYVFVFADAEKFKIE